MAPPRMLTRAGFVDVVAVSHAWGSWRTSALASHANELAAMPSLHIAWACWSALAMWRIGNRRSWRVGAVCYPLMTALVVMATANHFFVDVVAGLLTMAMATGTTELWRARRTSIKKLDRQAAEGSLNGHQRPLLSDADTRANRA